MMRLRQRQGQSVVEYVLLIIIVMAAFIATQTYFKRGLQGRWKEAVDDLGDQYDVQKTTTDIRHVLEGNSETRVMILNNTGRSGFWTRRIDISNSVERKIGSYQIEPP